jgi:hypothetical protein
MAKKYGADLNIVWLGSLFHDIARLEDAEPHDEIGSKKTYNLLITKGFDQSLAEKIKNIVLKHRCRNYLPKTLEEKIVASADAIAHFLPPFYLWVGKYVNSNFSKTMKYNIKKIERDYQSKIFFNNEKKMVREQYNILKKWFNFKI